MEFATQLDGDNVDQELEDSSRSETGMHSVPSMFARIL